MLMITFRKSFFLILLTLLYTTPAFAARDESFVIAAVVDDAVISKRDVEKRLNMALASSGLPQDPATVQNLLPQILRVMIDEKLYLEEADRQGIPVSKKDEDRAISNIEEQNGVEPGHLDEFLASKHVDKTVFLDQLKAQIAWNKVLSYKIRPKISVTDDEIDQEIEHALTYSGKEEVNISEISLPVDDPSKEMDTASLARDLVKRINRGSKFSSIAQQFSRGTNSSEGGAIGWVEMAQLSPDLRTILQSLPEGAVSQPLKLNDGYSIFKLNERRVVSMMTGSDLDKTKLEVKQLFFPAEHILTSKDMQRKREVLEQARAGVQDCSAMDDAANEIEDLARTDPINAPLEDFYPDIKDTVQDLPVGKPSPVVQTTLGLHVFMVCDRQIPESLRANLPGRDQIREKLIQKKMDIKAQSYLREIRRNAFIEVRL